MKICAELLSHDNPEQHFGNVEIGDTDLDVKNEALSKYQIPLFPAVQSSMASHLAVQGWPLTREGSSREM